MAVSVKNLKRHHAMRVSRAVKELFWGLVPKGWLYRLLFRADDGQTVRRVGEHVLADLRNFAGVGRPPFSSDPLIMARFIGRQEVVMRIINYLNLDEESVQKLMEIDDGI